MSTSPEPLPNEPEDSFSGEDVAPPSTDPLATENAPAPPAEWIGEPEEPNPSAAAAAPAVNSAIPIAEELFHNPAFDVQPSAPAFREERIPHLGHVALLGLLILFGLIGTMMIVPLGLHFHV
ncbi:MAG: hypothetical protein WBX19_18765, partial [Terracidiphilus sp.]